MTLISKNFHVITLNIAIVSGYDKRVRPYYGGKPVKVTAQVYTERMDVRDRALDMSLTIYLRFFRKIEKAAKKCRPGYEWATALANSDLTGRHDRPIQMLRVLAPADLGITVAKKK